jgi:serine/threonine-protein kinase
MIVDGTNDFVKLIDFGFARVPIEDLPHIPQGDQGPQWEMSQAGVVFGSVSYMAPDVALGMSNVDERSDLYALGLIFYEMLAGQHPFDVNLPPAALFELQRNRPPPPLREKNPDCDASEDLEWVIMRLLAKAPEERYQDASSVAAAIDGAMRGIQGFMQRRESHRPPAGLPSRSSVRRVDAPRASQRGVEAERSSRRGWLLGGAIALLAIVGAIAVVRLRVSDGALAPAPSASGLAPLVTSAPTASTTAALQKLATSAAPAKPGRDHRREFLAVADRPLPEAAAAWQRLVRADEKTLEDAAIQTKTVALLTRADSRDDSTRKVFEKLAYASGAVGLDVLYRVVEEQPDSSAAKRAIFVLYQAASGGRVSPALQVTLDLRRMNCPRKVSQFDRAAKDGDQRTLRELEKLHPPSCIVRAGACCFKDDPKLESSLAQIRERLPATGN